MGKDSSIEWTHSSLNLQMGCDGCELWNGTVKKCYAGNQTRGRAGNAGWPDRFEDPKLFIDRLGPALKWGPPTPRENEQKPWMEGLPRLIFLNDMGDTFSKKLALNWMAPLLGMMGASPHQFLLLTKRPSRMVEFSQAHPFPQNFWLGTSITSNKTIARATALRAVQGGGLKFLSIEPIWEDILPSVYDGMAWAIFGGESGDDPTHTCMDYIMNGVNHCNRLGVLPFVKQLGAKPYFQTSIGDIHDDPSPRRVPFSVKDSHGGDWSEWPAALRVRKMPAVPGLALASQASLL